MKLSQDIGAHTNTQKRRVVRFQVLMRSLSPKRDCKYESASSFCLAARAIDDMRHLVRDNELKVLGAKLVTDEPETQLSEELASPPFRSSR